MTRHQIMREADLIAKAAVYHAVKMVKQPPVTATHDPLVVRLNRLWRGRDTGNE